MPCIVWFASAFDALFYILNIWFYPTVIVKNYLNIQIYIHFYPVYILDKNLSYVVCMYVFMYVCMYHLLLQWYFVRNSKGHNSCSNRKYS